MVRELLSKSNSKISKIISASAIRDADIIYLEFEDVKGDQTKLELDPVSANGLRIAIGSLQNIPRLVLPTNKQGEYQSHFLSVKYTESGTLTFYKKDKETEPLGKYVDIEDGMIAFNDDDLLWIGFSTENAELCKLVSKDFFVLSFPEKKVLNNLKEQLDKEIFPFNRFGKTNKLSYGYFHTIKEEV